MNADNITDARPQTSGALYFAAAGTTLPSDASTTLAAAFKQLGYVTVDGFRVTENRDTVQWDAWEADDVVRVSNSHSVEIKFNLMEPFSEQAAKLMFGPDNVTAADGVATAIQINGDTVPEGVLVAEMLLRSGDKMRAVIGRFQVTEVGEFTFKRGEAIAPEVTGAAMGAAGANKVSYYFA